MFKCVVCMAHTYLQSWSLDGRGTVDIYGELGEDNC